MDANFNYAVTDLNFQYFSMSITPETGVQYIAQVPHIAGDPFRFVFNRTIAGDVSVVIQYRETPSGGALTSPPDSVTLKPAPVDPTNSAFVFNGQAAAQAGVPITAKLTLRDRFFNDLSTTTQVEALAYVANGLRTVSLLSMQPYFVSLTFTKVHG